MPGGAELVARIWVAQRRPRPAAAARHRHRGEPRPLPRGHRPALRRHQRAPAAPGAAARHRRRPRAARLHPDHRRPRARGLPHQRGPRRLPRPRADPRALGRRGRPGARLRHRARGQPRLDRLHDPHAGPGRHRPVPARARRAVLRRRVAGSRRTRRADPRARHRGLRGRRRQRLQHGRHGLPAGAARQRRLPAPRPRLPRDVRRAVAGLRRGRGPDHLDHQRRARPDLGRPRGLRAGRPSTAPTSTPPRPSRSGRSSTRSPAPTSGRPSGRCASTSSRTPAAGSRVLDPARLRAGRAGVDRLVPRPRRADHRVRPPRPVVQAAHADAVATPSGSSGCCSTPSGRSS